MPQQIEPLKKEKNKQEMKLQQAIDQAKNHVLILYDTSYKSPVLISDAININKDSLLIKAKGNIVLQSDSGYTGPAFKVAKTCKSITLDSLSISNFQVGVTTFANVLTLKNVRFNSCAEPVRQVFNIADKKYVSGKLSGAIFKIDSIPAK